MQVSSTPSFLGDGCGTGKSLGSAVVTLHGEDLVKSMHRATTHAQPVVEVAR